MGGLFALLAPFLTFPQRGKGLYIILSILYIHVK